MYVRHPNTIYTVKYCHRDVRMFCFRTNREAGQSLTDYDLSKEERTMCCVKMLSQRLSLEKIFRNLQKTEDWGEGFMFQMHSGLRQWQDFISNFH